MSVTIKLASIERFGKGFRVFVASWGVGGQYDSIEIDGRPESTLYESILNEPIDPGFVLIMFEVINAIQDEMTKRGRRDGRGRLVPPKRGLLGKAMNR